LIKVPQMKLETESQWVDSNINSDLKLQIKTTINNDNLFDFTTGDLNIKIYKSDGTVLGSILVPGSKIESIPH
jgi:hypothetical protein